MTGNARRPRRDHRPLGKPLSLITCGVEATSLPLPYAMPR
jgi:hypothetical protein